MTKQNTSGRFLNGLLKGLCIVSAICISSLSIAVDTDNDGLPDGWTQEHEALMSEIAYLEAEILNSDFNSLTPPEDLLMRLDHLSSRLEVKGQSNLAVNRYPNLVQRIHEMEFRLSEHLSFKPAIPLNDKSVPRGQAPQKSLEIFGASGAESDGPELVAISVNKVTLDVSSAPQTVTFSVDATDESGLDWGHWGTYIYLRHSNGRLFSAPSSNETPRVFNLTFDSDDPAGTYSITFMYLYDSLGNSSRFNSSTFQSFGLPAFLFLLSEGEATTDLTLLPQSESDFVPKNTEFTKVLDVKNLAPSAVSELDFELFSTNLRVKKVSSSGATACSISTRNYDSTVTCAMSGVAAESVKSISIDFEVGGAGEGVFHANVKSDNPALPDITYLDNYLSKTLTIAADSDGDGVPDPIDNCPNTENLDQLDTDGDSKGNACDTDDDNDGVPDASDALPLDVTESVDTDSDGIGNNADTDDDEDGLTDTQEATNGTNPLLSDTDGDGFSDGDESDQGSDPLDAQSTPSSGLSLLLIKAAIDLKNNTAEKVTQ